MVPNGLTVRDKKAVREGENSRWHDCYLTMPIYAVIWASLHMPILESLVGTFFLKAFSQHTTY